MFDKIKCCENCRLFTNQPPLVDTAEDGQVFWVGLSAKMSTVKGEKPLSPTTISGKLLENVEKKCEGITMYKTNLVKCVPLDESGKLRYPSKKEILDCIGHIKVEIENLTPKIIFMLGNNVTESIGKNYSVKFPKPKNFDYDFYIHKNTYYVPIHHPSYIYVYKRKLIDDYTDALVELIHKLL